MLDTGIGEQQTKPPLNALKGEGVFTVAKMKSAHKYEYVFKRKSVKIAIKYKSELSG